MPSINTHEVVARAVFDQATKAPDDAERWWPYNAWWSADPDVEARLLDAALGPDAETAWGGDARPDQVTILWPANGTAVPVPYGADVAALARQTFPGNGGRALCDLCEADERPYGALLFTFGAKVIGLILCDECARERIVAGNSLTWTYPTRHTTQGED